MRRLLAALLVLPMGAVFACQTGGEIRNPVSRGAANAPEPGSAAP